MNADDGLNQLKRLLQQKDELMQNLVERLKRQQRQISQMLIEKESPAVKIPFSFYRQLLTVGPKKERLLLLKVCGDGKDPIWLSKNLQLITQSGSTLANSVKSTNYSPTTHQFTSVSSSMLTETSHISSESTYMQTDEVPPILDHSEDTHSEQINRLQLALSQRLEQINELNWERSIETEERKREIREKQQELNHQMRKRQIEWNKAKQQELEKKQLQIRVQLQNKMKQRQAEWKKREDQLRKERDELKKMFCDEAYNTQSHITPLDFDSLPVQKPQPPSSSKKKKTFHLHY